MKRYAISDIHGNAYAFLKLLDHVDPDPEQLVILGDLCDRGFQTWEVYEECAQLVDEGTTIIRGNHDTWYKQFRDGTLSYGEFTNHQVGGLTTLRSMDLAIERHKPDKVYDTLMVVENAMIPYLEEDDYIFVHAGIDPRIPYMSSQNTEVLQMGCNEWKNPQNIHPFDQYIIFGHTPTYWIHKDILENNARAWMSHRAKKIAIDTGAGFGARLTMIDLWEGIAYAYDFSQGEIIDYRFMRGGRKR